MAVTPKNLIGSNVCKLRTQAGMTQDALAAKLQRGGWDIARGTLAKIEAGLRRVNDGEIFLLAKGLNIELADLLKGIKTPQALEVARQGKG
jgi:transcriptional regulator with XRE-family HTH domain